MLCISDNPIPAALPCCQAAPPQLRLGACENGTGSLLARMKNKLLKIGEGNKKEGFFSPLASSCAVKKRSGNLYMGDWARFLIKDAHIQWELVQAH